MDEEDGLSISYSTCEILHMIKNLTQQWHVFIKDILILF